MHAKFLEIEITGRCCFYCKHCYGSFPKQVELPKEKVKEIIDQTPHGYGIIFSGGEPFMHKDLIELVNYAKNYVWITTNGYFLTKKKLNSLSEKATLVFGLDGTGSTHDWYRGYQGSYRKVIEALELAKDKPKEIIATIWKGMLPQIDDIIEIGRKYSSIVHFNALIPVGRAGTNTHIMLTQQEKELVLHKLKDLQRGHPDLFTDLYKITEEDVKKGIDLFCKGRFCVGPDGDVRPCEFHQAKFGNVFEDKFENIVERAEQTSFYRAREKGFKDYIKLELTDLFDYHTNICHKILINQILTL